MNKKILYIILLVLLLAGAWAGFNYRNKITGVYEDVGKNIDQNLENFKKTDFGNAIESIAKQITAPGPLNMGGQENNVVLANSKVIAQTNFQRYGNGGLTPLFENVKLNTAAKAKAEDILKNQYFEHISPSGVDPGELVKSFGYEYIVSGENLILGNFESEAEAVAAWMASPGHRANILNERFTDIGVAFIKGIYRGKTVWVGVQEFGLPLSACQSPNADLKAEIEGNKTKLDNLSVQIEAKRAEINKTNKNSPQYNVKVDEYNAMVNQYNELSKNTKNIITQYNAQINNFNDCIAGE